MTNRTESHTRYTNRGEEILTLTRSKPFGDVVYVILYVNAEIEEEHRMTVNQANAKLNRFLGRHERQFF